MRIAIDARLNAYRQGGIPQYTRQLLAALAEVAQDDQIISLQHRDQLRPLAVAPNVARQTVLTPPHHRFEQWTLPLEVLFARPDVLHCPDFIAPVRRPCPAVVTIHDLAFLHYPEILDDAARAYYGQVKVNAPRADAIIAVSEATRQDIAQFLDIPIEQIDVVHEAPAPLYGRLELRPGEARVLQATPVVANSFMLFVSTLEPRKNLPTLLQALRICLDRRPAAGYRLVVVGGRGWRDDAIFAAVRDLRLGDHVFFAGAVGQYDLRWLYNACRMYINPSLYEGFGLPLLEAMACGAPCLAAATSSLPEIGGTAAIYVPPLDAGLWADAIEELWDDEERQAMLGRLGRVQAQRFSWLRAARETLKIYQRVVERRAGATALPTQAQQMELPNIDLAEGDLAAVERLIGSGAEEPRSCLRCGAELLAGQVQHSLTITAPDTLLDARPLIPRAWACSRCGHVELMIDWAESASKANDRPQGAEEPLAVPERLNTAPPADRDRVTLPVDTILDSEPSEQTLPATADGPELQEDAAVATEPIDTTGPALEEQLPTSGVFPAEDKEALILPDLAAEPPPVENIDPADSDAPLGEKAIPPGVVDSSDTVDFASPPVTRNNGVSESTSAAHAIDGEMHEERGAAGPHVEDGVQQSEVNGTTPAPLDRTMQPEVSAQALGRSASEAPETPAPPPKRRQTRSKRKHSS
jgi:glycosyltransferase involved in cell wall biosynthesis